MDKAARDLLERARDAHDPTAADRARVRRKLAVRVVAGSAALGGMAKASMLGSSTLLKIALPLVILGAAGAYAVHAARVQAPAPIPTASTIEVPAIVAPPQVAAEATTVVPPPATTEAPAITAPPVVSHAAQHPKPRVEAPPDLDAENLLVTEAQGAIQRKDFATALAKLDAYDRAFHAGILVEEARAARVVAVCGAGRTAEAQTLGRVFLATYPRSPLAPRVRTSCAAP
jgi:hypothetical protein